MIYSSLTSYLFAPYIIALGAKPHDKYFLPLYYSPNFQPEIGRFDQPYDLQGPLPFLLILRSRCQSYLNLFYENKGDIE